METIRIALQKSGRLSEDCMKLLNAADVKIPNNPGKLVAMASNFPIEALFLRDDDIPEYVADGVADIGIVGENGLLESGYELQTIERLGFSKCRLSLAIPKTEEYTGPAYFNGKKIATSYPKILANYLNKNNIKGEIHTISGSVEIAPGIGLADGIFDIVSSGSTLISNGLKEVETVLKSEALLVATPKLNDAKQKTLNQLLFRIRAVQKAQNSKYILLNAPDENITAITQLIPGMKSPTIMPLATKGWSSLHSVVNENDFWEVIDRIKALGAQGILVIPIEKMIA
jgi:ATP phosphoribosyltransferase